MVKGEKIYVLLDEVDILAISSSKEKLETLMKTLEEISMKYWSKEAEDYREGWEEEVKAIIHLVPKHPPLGDPFMNIEEHHMLDSNQ